MACEAPSWAEQWGAGGIGATPEEENPEKKEPQRSNKSSALGKAKAAIFVGTYKMKNGMSKGIKWFTNHFHTRGSTN